MDWTFKRSWFDLWQGQEIFLFSNASTLTVGPAHCPIQWVPGALTMGVKQPDMQQTVQHCPVMRFGMCISYTFAPPYDILVLTGTTLYIVIRYLTKCQRITRGSWWCIWLQYCTTSWKVVGSLPFGVIGIFHWFNCFGWGLTQPLTDMSTTDVTWGKGSWCIGLTTLLPACSNFLEILGSCTSWNPKGLFRPIQDVTGRMDQTSGGCSLC